MLFFLPPKRYKTLPTELIGKKKAVFLNQQGRLIRFKPGVLLSLGLNFKSEADYRRFVSPPKKSPKKKQKPRKRASRPPVKVKKSTPAKRIAKPKRKPAVKRGRPAPSRKAKPGHKRLRPVPRKKLKAVKKSKKLKKLKKRRPTSKRGTIRVILPKARKKKKYKRGPSPRKAPKTPLGWISTDKVMSRLDRQYEGIIYKDVKDFQGEYYNGRGFWQRTIWPNKKIQPDMPIRSLFLFAVYASPTYEGKKRTGPAEYIFVGKHIGWKTTPGWVLDELGKPGERELMPDMSRASRSKLDNLLGKVFLGCGDIEEFVGIRFSMKKPPVFIPNPYKKRKRKKKA